jgi:predicted nucleic acid-binding protein
VILVDTSVWVQHLRRSDAVLARLLEHGEVLIHPFIVGELAMGGLWRREAVLNDLQELPAATAAADVEVLDFVERMKLYGRGIGYVDAHLLASARLTPDCALWTRDRRLAAIAAELNLAAEPG